MRRSLKRQIKQDEFRSGVEHAMGYVRAHPQESTLIAVVVVAVGVGWWGIGAWQSHRRSQAEEALSAAREIFVAPVSSELEPGASPPPGPTFTSAAEKYRRAADAFDSVANRFGSGVTGVRARYYAALCRIELGDFAQAQKTLRDIIARGPSLEADLAKLALAESEGRSGQTDKAIEAYRQMADGPVGALPREHALMRLASLLEEAGRLKEAATSYRRLAEDYPGSVYAGEARRRAEYLQGAS